MSVTTPRVAGSPRVSLGKIHRIVQEATAGGLKFKSFVIISPNRASWTKDLGLPQSDAEDAQLNQEKFKQIMQDLSGMTCQKPDGTVTPCGYRLCDGIGQEGGTNQHEKSFFVPNMSYRDARRLWARYKQWGIVYAGPETKKQVRLMHWEPDANGRTVQVEQDLGAMHTFTHDDNKAMMLEEEAARAKEDSEGAPYNDAFRNKTRVNHHDFLFASKKAALFTRKAAIQPGELHIPGYGLLSKESTIEAAKVRAGLIHQAAQQGHWLALKSYLDTGVLAAMATALAEDAAKGTSQPV